MPTKATRLALEHLIAAIIAGGQPDQILAEADRTISTFQKRETAPKRKKAAKKGAKK